MSAKPTIRPISLDVEPDGPPILAVVLRIPPWNPSESRMTERVTSGSMSGEGNEAMGYSAESDNERRRLLQAPPVLHIIAPFLNYQGNPTVVTHLIVRGSPNRFNHLQRLQLLGE